ncbi:MAG: ABC transporter substrate-binding protein [Chloroflexota bacterium]
MIAAALIAAGGARVSAQTKITIGVTAMSPRTIPLLIAQEQGLFAKQGIEARIVLIEGAPTLVASLISGDIEVGYTGGTAVLGAASQGLYLRIHSPRFRASCPIAWSPVRTSKPPGNYAASASPFKVSAVAPIPYEQACCFRPGRPAAEFSESCRWLKESPLR